MENFNTKTAEIKDLKALAWDLRIQIDNYSNALNQIVAEISKRGETKNGDTKESKDITKEHKSEPAKTRN